MYYLAIINLFKSDGFVSLPRERCKSGRAIWVGLGPKVDKILGLIRASEVLFVLGAQKYNQNNRLIFSDLT